MTSQRATLAQSSSQRPALAQSSGQRPTLAQSSGQRPALADARRRRLTLAVPSLALGGAERVVAKMANYWAERGDLVTVVTLSAETCDTYSLDSRVTRIPLNAMRDSQGPIDAIRDNLARLRALRAAIARSQPDAIISFTDRMNVLTVLACRPFAVGPVISERIDPSQYEIGRAWSWLRRRVYPGPGARGSDRTSPQSTAGHDARPADLRDSQRG